MDMSKIASKVAKMAPVSKKSRILAEIPSVGISKIQEMQVRARKENKTLAEVMKEETKPELFKTVSAKELKEINEKSKETGQTPGQLLREKVGDNGEDRIEVKTEDEKKADLPAKKDEVDLAPNVLTAEEVSSMTKEPANTVDDAGTAKDSAKDPSPMPYNDVINSTSLAKLKDFAKAAGLDFKAKILKADLAALVFNETLQEDFDIFFVE